jgi:hypothetical protein
MMQFEHSQMENLVPQMSTTMLGIVCASERHVCEFAVFKFAFDGVKTAIYTISTKRIKWQKVNFIMHYKQPHVHVGSPNAHTNVRDCVRV